MGPHCTFVIDEKSLYFANVILNSTYQINLHIRNVAQIATNINFLINDDEQGVFSVTPETISVEPFSSVTIAIRFKPTSIEVRLVHFNVIVDFN